MSDQIKLPQTIYSQLSYIEACYKNLLIKYDLYPIDLFYGVSLLTEKVGEIAQEVNNYVSSNGNKHHLLRIKSEIGDTTNLLICMLTLIDVMLENTNDD